MINNFDPNSVPVGFVHLFSSHDSFPENEWMLLEGQSLDIDLYPELFRVIGFTFGGENGYFKLPDYRLNKDELAIGISDSLMRDCITDKYGIKVKSTNLTGE